MTNCRSHDAWLWMYPFVQYQLLKTVDTLSLLPAVHADPHYQEMVDRLKSKQNAEGRWLAESINKSCSPRPVFHAICTIEMSFFVFITKMKNNVDSL